MLTGLRHLGPVPPGHHRATERCDASLFDGGEPVYDEVWGEVSLDAEALA